MTLPETMWYPEQDCLVTVLRAGHFPTTVIVRLPDGKEVEVEINALEEKK